MDDARANLFGMLAVKVGLATREQVDECLRVQQEARTTGGTVLRLGEVMARSGYLSHEQVNSILRGDFAEPGKRFGELCVQMRFCPADGVKSALAEQLRLRSGGSAERLGEIMLKQGTIKPHQLPAVLSAQGFEIAECTKCRLSYNVVVDAPASSLKCARCDRDLIMVTGYEDIDGWEIGDDIAPSETPSAKAAASEVLAAEELLAPERPAGGTVEKKLPPGRPTKRKKPAPATKEAAKAEPAAAAPQGTDKKAVDNEVSSGYLAGRKDPTLPSKEAADAESIPSYPRRDRGKDLKRKSSARYLTGRDAPSLPSEQAEQAEPVKPAPKPLQERDTVKEPPVDKEAPTDEAPLGEAPEELPDEEEAAVYGEFRIIQRLGEDALGTLYQAEHLTTGQVVAFKLIDLERTRDKGFTERFVAETKRASSLDHPNIKRVVAAGRAAGHLYYATEFVDGTSVRQIMGQKGKLPPAEAARIAGKVAEGLCHAHSRSIYHGDIRPCYIIVSAEGDVKLAECGVAKNVHENIERLVQRHGVTPFYVAPELAAPSGVADARADIYELGASLFHMVTGRPPFEGNTPLQILMRMAEEEPPKAHEVDPKVPAKLSKIIRKMMAPRIRDRFQDMDEVVDVLGRISSK